MSSLSPPSAIRLRSDARRVLVVDDDADCAELVALILEGAGHQATIAHCAADALRIVGALRPHLLISDVGLSGMNGFELVRALRRDRGQAGCRYVALSGHRSPPPEEAGTFDEYLVKPVSFEDLQRVAEATPVAFPHAERA